MMMFNLMRRSFSSNTWPLSVINDVTIVGGGQMGSGIAQVVAQYGVNVSVVEGDDLSLKKCQQKITKNILKHAEKLFKDKPEEANSFIEGVFSKMKFSLDLEGAVQSTDLVIEAIVEDLKAKRKVFETIDKVARSQTIFTTNTSSIPVTEIARDVERKDRFAGVHFFNPVPIMQLVEIVRTEETSDATYGLLVAWAQAIDRVPITCKDTPGFIVNRLLFPLICEAIRMCERGDATLKDIDAAMKLGCNHPMGPIELADYIGHDVITSCVKVWRDIEPENPLFQPLASQMKLVEEGKLGVKVGEGYYKYK